DGDDADLGDLAKDLEQVVGVQEQDVAAPPRRDRDREDEDERKRDVALQREESLGDDEASPRLAARLGRSRRRGDGFGGHDASGWCCSVAGSIEAAASTFSDVASFASRMSTMRPRRITAIRWQIPSSSGSSDDATITVTPSAANDVSRR